MKESHIHQEVKFYPTTPTYRIKRPIKKERPNYRPNTKPNSKATRKLLTSNLNLNKTLFLFDI